LGVPAVRGQVHVGSGPGCEACPATQPGIRRGRADRSEVRAFSVAGVIEALHPAPGFAPSLDDTSRALPDLPLAKGLALIAAAADDSPCMGDGGKGGSCPG
jgi:hypothetical protein